MYTKVEILKNGKYVKMFEQTVNNPCAFSLKQNLLIQESIDDMTQCILKTVCIFLHREIYLKNKQLSNISIGFSGKFFFPLDASK